MYMQVVQRNYQQCTCPAPYTLERFLPIKSFECTECRVVNQFYDAATGFIIRLLAIISYYESSQLSKRYLTTSNALPESCVLCQPSRTVGSTELYSYCWSSCGNQHTRYLARNVHPGYIRRITRVTIRVYQFLYQAFVPS